MSDDFTLGQLELAFAYHVVQQVIMGDGVIDPGERKFVEDRFPTELMRQSGFQDGAGHATPRFHAALGDALLELPSQLGLDEKLELIDVLLDASLADFDHHIDEGTPAARAARLLDVTTLELEAHFRARGDDMPVPRWPPSLD